MSIVIADGTGKTLDSLTWQSGNVDTAPTGQDFIILEYLPKKLLVPPGGRVSFLVGASESAISFMAIIAATIDDAVVIV